MDEVWHPSEQWSDSERRVWQERRLVEIVEAAWEHAPGLRERLNAAGVKPHRLTLDALTRLPVLSKDTFPDAQHRLPPFGGWLGVPVQDTVRVYRSPGPILDPEGRDDDYWRFAPALFAAGLRPGDMVVNTLPYHVTPAGHMIDGGLRALRCPVVPVGPGDTETRARLLDELPITGFAGAPSVLTAVLETARMLAIEPKIRTAFVVGEVLTGPRRGRLESQFEMRVRQGYGTSELGSIAYECSQTTGLHIHRETVVELVDRSTGKPAGLGEPGEVVVTALNTTYPLVRFGTGDLAIMAIGSCACGRTGPRLERIVGRAGDAVKVRGMLVHPTDVERIMARFPDVARYQLVVTRSGQADEMRVRVEMQPQGTPSPLLRDRVQQEISEGLRLRVDVEVVPAGTLTADDRRLVDERAHDGLPL